MASNSAVAVCWLSLAVGVGALKTGAEWHFFPTTPDPNWNKHPPLLMRFYKPPTPPPLVTPAPEDPFTPPIIMVAEPESPCQCIPYTAAYSQMGVKCGDGPEKAGALNFYENMVMQGPFCTQFFEKANFNSCLNAEAAIDTHQQWCYVSDKCQNLNGGYKVNRDKATASVKFCQAGVDDLMHSKTVAELVYMSRAADVNLGHLIKMSYPIFPHKLWVDAENYYMNAPDSEMATWRERADMPYVYDSKNHGPPFGVVVGEQIYQVRNTRLAVEMALTLESPGNNNEALMTEVRCRRNCGDGVQAPILIKPQEPQNAVALFKVPPRPPTPVQPKLFPWSM